MRPATFGDAADVDFDGFLVGADYTLYFDLLEGVDEVGNAEGAILQKCEMINEMSRGVDLLDDDEIFQGQDKKAK